MSKFKVFSMVLLLCTMACGGKPKQVLESDEQKQQKQLDQQLNLLYASEMVLDTIIPNPGIKYKESRAVDPQHPPIKLKLGVGIGGEDRDLDLANFYSQVEFVKLKHPLSEKGIAFLGNSNFKVEYEKGASSGRNVNSYVFLSDNKIVAGDNFFGYHCFDSLGAYSYTIAAVEELPTYDIQKSEVSFFWNPAMNTIRSFSMLDDNCFVFRTQKEKGSFDFHNLKSQKNYLTRPASRGQSKLVSPDTYMGFVYHAGDPNQNPAMILFDIKGDTLCKFMNYNPLVQLRKSSYTNPESTDTYYYNNILTVRQAYNDTIYRVAKNSLTPTFVLEVGNKKATPEIALFGDKAGKIFISKLFETDNFLLIIHTENYDCPNTRKDRSVKFFYSYYDKKSKNLYRIQEAGYPEVFTLKNSIAGSMPVLVDNIKTYKDKLYTSYTKNQIQSMMLNESFSAFSQAQQAKIKEMYDSLSEYELLVMILK